MNDDGKATAHITFTPKVPTNHIQLKIEIIQEKNMNTPQSFPRHEVRVAYQNHCVMVFGSVPFELFSALSKSLPKDAVMSTLLAQITGATLAMGPPKNIEELCLSLAPKRLEEMTRLLAGTGLSQKAIEWLAVGQRGLSSEAIFYRLTGHPPKDRVNKHHPHDADDFRRCRMLLEHVPELKPRISEMSDVSPEWAALVRYWDQLCVTLDLEMPDWESPKKCSSWKNTNTLIYSILGDFE